MPLHEELIEGFFPRLPEIVLETVLPFVPAAIEGTLEATSAVFRAGGEALGWFDSALTLIGDLLDPIFPGGAASETRVAARGGAGSRRRLSAAGVVISGTGVGRRRRRRALTASDKADLAFITATMGAPAAKTALALMITRTNA